MEKILGEGNVKWDWCNRKWENLKLEDKDKEKVKKFYESRQKAQYTIYIGDMFYVHETNSKKLGEYLNEEYNSGKKKKFDQKILNRYIKDYIKDMLNAHIRLLENNNIDLKFIYVNSAAVSDYICDALDVKDCTWCKYNYNYNDVNTIPIFFGSMISNGQMDKYSNRRLVNEIKNEVKI